MELGIITADTTEATGFGVENEEAVTWAVSRGESLAGGVLARGVDKEGEDAGGEESSEHNGEHPSSADTQELFPVNSSLLELNKTYTNGGTNLAMSSRNGQTDTGCDDDSDSGTDLDGETTGRGKLGQLHADCNNDTVSPHGETSNNTDTSKSENPKIHGLFLAGVVGGVTSGTFGVASSVLGEYTFLVIKGEFGGGRTRSTRLGGGEH